MIEKNIPAIDAWEIHWRLHLDSLVACEAMLDESERAKATAFRFDDDRHRYILSHGALRSILSHKLDLPPQRVPIVQVGWVKPQLAAPLSLQFNLSHSGDLALVAVSRSLVVGVDVEQIKTDFDLAALASRFFSTQESAALFRLPPAEQVDAFFRIWTRKESFLKARGDGLSLPLAEFDVSLDAQSKSALLATRFDPAEVSRWRVADLAIAPGYAAALTANGSHWTVTRHQWNGISSLH